MQDRELAQQIEDLIEVADMELELEPRNEDVDLMLSAPQVIIQSPPPLAAEPASSEEGAIIPLDDDMVMDLYNLSYNEFQNKIVQARRKNFFYNHTSLTFIKERVIVADIRKNLNAIFKPNLAFAGAAISNTLYLMVENKQLAQYLHAAMQEVEQLRAIAMDISSTQVYLEEMREKILSEVLTLGETMQNLHEDLVTVHKAIVCLHGLQQQSKDFVKTLRNVQDVITYMQEQTM